MKAKQIPAKIRAALAHRSGGVCECCGRRDAEHAHHRQPRGMGGSRRILTNLLTSLLHLCAICHDWIESFREKAYAKGWLVHSWNDPAEVPVFIRGEPLFLAGEGYRTPEPGELIDTMRLAYPGGE